MIWKRLFHRRNLDLKLDEEIRSHLRMATDDRIASGTHPREAARQHGKSSATN